MHLSLMRVLQKDCNENSDKWYIFELGIEYLKQLRSYVTYTDLPFLPERIKVKKWNIPVCNLYDKEKYVVHMITL